MVKLNAWAFCSPRLSVDGIFTSASVGPHHGRLTPSKILLGLQLNTNMNTWWTCLCSSYREGSEVSTADKVDSSLEEVMEFINEQIKSCQEATRLRGPYLAQMELVRILRERKSELLKLAGEGEVECRVYYNTMQFSTVLLPCVEVILLLCVMVISLAFVKVISLPCVKVISLPCVKVISLLCVKVIGQEILWWCQVHWHSHARHKMTTTNKQNFQLI